VVRVLGILKLLAEGSRPTVYELAARFGTRRETIYRDLHALEDAGYPIEGGESGRLSRPRLAPEARAGVPPVLLTRQELAALVWAVRRTDGCPSRATWPPRCRSSRRSPRARSLASRSPSTAPSAAGSAGSRTTPGSSRRS